MLHSLLEKFPIGITQGDQSFANSGIEALGCWDIQVNVSPQFLVFAGDP